MIATTYNPESYKYLDMLKKLDKGIKDDLCNLLAISNWFPNWMKVEKIDSKSDSMTDQEYNDFMNSFSGAWAYMEEDYPADEMIADMKECGKRSNHKDTLIENLFL